MIYRKSIFVLVLALSSMVFATKYEAESATLSGGAKNVNASGVSGTGYADLQEGNISFNGVTAESAGKYQVTIHYKAGDFKANYLKVPGSCRFRFLVCKRSESKRKLEQGIHGQSYFNRERPLESGRHPSIHLALERPAR